MKTIGVQFTPEEETRIYNHFDLNSDGLLRLKEVNSIIVDILMGHIFFHTAKKERDLRSVDIC